MPHLATQHDSHRGRAISRRGSTRALMLAALLVLGAAREAAAVAVSPIALYIDSRSRTGTLTLYNDGARPEEIEIAFAFGYPRSDSLGNVAVALADSAPAGEPSVVPWLRAFPRRLVLQPGQRQVVRVMVQPPAGVADGEFWGRVLVKSRGGQAPIEQTQGDVTLQINLETVVAVAVSYRHGSVSTGLDVTRAEVSREGADVVTTLDLRRTGNAAFLGRLRAELLDSSGRVVGTAEDLLAVYHDLRRRIAIPAPAGATGPFRVRLTVDTVRDDLPPEGPLPVSTITRVVPEGR